MAHLEPLPRENGYEAPLFITYFIHRVWYSPRDSANQHRYGSTLVGTFEGVSLQCEGYPL